jgi:hypothetical protein
VSKKKIQIRRRREGGPTTSSTRIRFWQLLFLYLNSLQVTGWLWAILNAAKTEQPRFDLRQQDKTGQARHFRYP